MDSLPPGFHLCLFPAGIPPDGAVVNFNNSSILAPVLIAVCVIMLSGAVLFTTCRLIANKGKLWWSDYFVSFALILSIVQTGLLLSQTRYARHQWDVRACWYDGEYTKILFTQQIIFSCVLFFSKGAIFLLYYQIFDIQRPMSIAIRVGMVFAGVLYFTNIPLAAILSAPHIGETWESVLTSGRPQKDLIWGIVQAALGVALDLYIFILPIPIILRLQLSTKRKIQILAVFTTAMVGVIASVLSLVYRVEAIDTNDGTWKYTALLICNVVENNVAIIVSCTPSFVKFSRFYISELAIVKSLRSIVMGSSSNSSGSTTKYSLEQKENPNRPRTRNNTGRKKSHELDDLEPNFLKTVSTESSEVESSPLPLPPTSNVRGIAQTTDHFPLSNQPAVGTYNLSPYGDVTYASRNTSQDSTKGLVTPRPVEP